MNKRSIIKVTLCLLILACMFSSISFVFAASPSISLSPTSGCVGTSVTISGGGFGSENTVTIKYGSTIITTVNTDANGKFELTLNVPKTSPGIYTIQAKSGTKIATATFTVTKAPTALTLHFTPTTVGLTDTISGGGRLTNTFDGSGVSGTIEILYYRVGSTPHELHSLMTLSAGNNGWYGIDSMTLPPNTHLGDYIIVARYGGDDNYLPSAVEAGPQLTVVPEYLFGGLAAMAACFGAFIIVKKRSNLLH
jgi:hypothetical protein